MDGESGALARLYGVMSVGELQALARAYDGLSETAQAVLRAEFGRRGMEPPLVEDGEPDEPEDRRLVTVRRYRDLSEAIVARSLLESAGMPVVLQDENLVRLDWQVSNFIGGMRLQVEAADAAIAREMLEQAVPEAIAFGAGEAYEQPRCPRCGSVEVTFEGAKRGAALVGLFALAVPLPTGAQTWWCEACGARWVED